MFASSPETRRRPSQFTLVELLVVVVIIMILAGLLLPALQQARARAKMTRCTTQLTQFGIALVSYRDDSDNSMVGWLSNLNSQYVPDTRIYVCPQDSSGGNDGSRPGAGWPSNSAHTLQFGGSSYVSPDDQPDKYDVVDAVLEDKYFDTDDTSRNQNRWRSSGNSAVKNCSYMYEFADTECQWRTAPLTGFTWNQVKHDQLRRGIKYDEATNGFILKGTPWDSHLFPAVRCFYHYRFVWGKREIVLNTSYEGGYFLSRLTWEDGIYQ